MKIVTLTMIGRQRLRVSNGRAVLALGIDLEANGSNADNDEGVVLFGDEGAATPAAVTSTRQ